MNIVKSEVKHCKTCCLAKNTLITCPLVVLGKHHLSVRFHFGKELKLTRILLTAK